MLGEYAKRQGVNESRHKIKLKSAKVSFLIDLLFLKLIHIYFLSSLAQEQSL